MNETRPSFRELTADKLQSHPELLAVPRDNCARWLADGHNGPEYLRQWDALLCRAQSGEFEPLRKAMLGEGSEPLRDFHPMAGILTREERREARELCGYRH